MVQYSPVDIRIHHQSAADHQQIMHIWILCQNVLSGNISFSRNQDQKQNEVNRCLFPITMIVSIDFRPFSEWKSENFQNVLSGNGGSGNHRMLLLLPARTTYSSDLCSLLEINLDKLRVCSFPLSCVASPWSQQPGHTVSPSVMDTVSVDLALTWHHLLPCTIPWL